MKSIFILLSVFFSFQSFGQVEFAPQGAEWHVGTSNWFNWSAPSYGLLVYRYEGVSFELDGYTAKELIVGDTKDTIAQDGNQIFVYNKGQFVLIYDFGQAIGDTLSVPNWALSDNPIVDLIVAKIDTVEINGDTLMNFTYNVPSLDPHGDSYLVANNKFGGLNVDILNPFAYQIDYGLGFDFRCYSDNDFGFYQVGDVSCDSIFTVALDELARLDVNILPNPVASIMQVEFSNSDDILGYQVLDLMGARVQTGKVIDGKIYIDRLPKGLYVIELRSQKGNIMRQRFVKM